MIFRGKRRTARVVPGWGSVLLGLGLLGLLGGCAKKEKAPNITRFTHPNAGYSIEVPKGWTPRLRDRVNLSVLEIRSDTTLADGEQPEIVVLSDDHRLPLSFDNVARDAEFKTSILRTSSRQFSILDSSRIMVDGREGVVFTYERVPRRAKAGTTPRHVVMVFLQATQGMVSIKYISPVPQSKEIAALFNANLNSFHLRDTTPEMSEAEAKRLHDKAEAKRREMMEQEGKKPQPPTQLIK